MKTIIYIMILACAKELKISFEVIVKFCLELVEGK